ncbi:hypothetical protein UlMin_043916 [Ulmus minor]
MEISSVVSRQVPCFSGAGTDTHFSKPSISGVSFAGSSRLLGFPDSGVSSRPRRFPAALSSGFSDNGHLQYYHAGPRCGEKKKKNNKEKEKASAGLTTKEKLKLLKGFSESFSAFSGVGFGLEMQEGLVAQAQSNQISEAADVFLKQLEQLRAEEKDIEKRRRKEEKAKLKAERMAVMLDKDSSSSSSSESSSDSECGEAIDMSRSLRAEPTEPAPRETTWPSLSFLTRSSIEQKGLGNGSTQLQKREESECCTGSDSTAHVNGSGSVARGSIAHVNGSGSIAHVNGSGSIAHLNGSGSVAHVNGSGSIARGSIAHVNGSGSIAHLNGSGSIAHLNGSGSVAHVNGSNSSTTKRVEVCMGNKCKKSGAAALFAEFEQAVGMEGAVVGCKCMGKCKVAPNVRVRNDQAEGAETNTLFQGVGLENVSAIVANLLWEEGNAFNLAAST